MLHRWAFHWHNHQEKRLASPGEVKDTHRDFQLRTQGPHHGNAPTGDGERPVPARKANHTDRESERAAAGGRMGPILLRSVLQQDPLLREEAGASVWTAGPLGGPQGGTIRQRAPLIPLCTVQDVPNSNALQTSTQV